MLVKLCVGATTDIRCPLRSEHAFALDCFFLALTWLVWVSGFVVAETMIAAERLRTSSIDSQLIRLILRLLTIIVAIAILVTVADRIGLSAYSVLAGLGVGGFAVALAAQQTLAILLGGCPRIRLSNE